jgi:hypothetical protein
VKEQPHYQPDQSQAPHQRGEGIRGVPPPSEPAKPQQESALDQIIKKLQEEAFEAEDADKDKIKTIWKRHPQGAVFTPGIGLDEFAEPLFSKKQEKQGQSESG